jgi:hypothetical protein
LTQHKKKLETLVSGFLPSTTCSLGGEVLTFYLWVSGLDHPEQAEWCDLPHSAIYSTPWFTVPHVFFSSPDRATFWVSLDTLAHVPVLTVHFLTKLKLLGFGCIFSVKAPPSTYLFPG